MYELPLPASSSVPISKLPTLVRETSEDFEKRGLVACHFGYAPSSLFHPLFLAKLT